MTLEQGAEVARVLGQRPVVHLQNHGVVVAGASVEEVVIKAIWLEGQAKLTLLASMIGTPHGMRAEEVEFQARASAHEVTGQLRARRLAQALEMGDTFAEQRAQPPQRVEKRQRAATADRLFATTDQLFELLMTQQADGSFRLSPALQSWLGQRWPAVKAAAEQHGEALVATAVVVALLAQEAADRADEWGPAVAKAQHWLAQQGRHIAVETWL